MGRQSKRAPQAEPPRPRCTKCGQPGVYVVSLEVKELKLERDAGMSARPYWRADYHSGAKLEAVLCEDCQQGSVSITTSVSATLANAKEKP
ncbi:MAG TPA: hypothetical protein VLE97_06560 [Gaiellaceae bacterium]|nr:hypothetical protein [Gaiellaceae bacterium]